MRPNETLPSLMPAAGDGAARGPRVLVVSDSHGTSYAGRSYVDYLTAMLAERPSPAVLHSVSFSGTPLAKWEKQLAPLLEAGAYHVVIVQYGNADVHPRLPSRLRRGFQSLTGIRLRDSWFQVPPRFGPKYILKTPFFVLKRLLIAAGGADTYTTPQRLLDFYLEVRSLVNDRAHLVIVPLLRVRSWMYGPTHNEAVDLINRRLREHFGDLVLSIPDPATTAAYVADGFHWREEFHQLVAAALSERIPLQSDDRTSAPVEGEGAH